MNKNKSAIVIVIVIVIVLVVLFAIPRFSDPTRAQVKAWKEEGINCLPSHQNASLHIHPILQIIIDGRPEVILANLGIVRSCMAEIHTHDGSGTLHVESVLATKTFTLDQFFKVWGKTLERDGFSLEMTVDGLASQELGNLILRDGQQIILKYTKQQ